MPHPIRQLLAWLTHFLLPSPSGRHRASPPLPVRLGPANPPLPPARHVRHTEPLNGEATALVRPYLVAHEERQRRPRPRTLYLATHGVYVNPKLLQQHPAPVEASACVGR